LTATSYGGFSERSALEVQMYIEGNSFIIRNLHINEIKSVVEVYKQCEDFLSLGPVASASIEMVLNDMKISEDEGGIFCGIYQGTEMIGIVDFVLSNFEGVTNHAFISLLMISMHRRRKGLGKEIVKLIEEEILKDSGVDTILSGVQVNNTEAIKFWNRLNYKIVSEAKLMPDKTTVYDLRKDVFS
jgi:ribosomal protein S18 acetylase RimI-like enzyme